MHSETPAASVLLIEDEAKIRGVIRSTLTRHGYRLYEASTGREGMANAAARNPDLILLDLGLPDLDGLEVIRQVRRWAAIPIIVLSARGQEQSKVNALDAGADDYVTKPFGINELLARMRVVLRHAARRAEADGEPVFAVGDLRVDLEHREVRVSGKTVRLTPIEFKLLAVLVKQAGKVLTYRQLLKEVWGPLHVAEAHYVRVYMQHLRNKLEAKPAHPRYLITELGVGYRLRVD
ncbi:MAG TPA: response regulator [Nitrospiria bacterium]|nr:response regulator [Nitrospiria bacterium]